MEINTHIDGDAMRIVLQGRLDAAWSVAVGTSLQDSLHSGCHHIALDMSQVSFLSSAGIRVLMLLFKQLQSVGGRLTVLDPAPPVRSVLDMVGFSRWVEISSAAAASAPAEARPAEAIPTLSIGEHTLEIYPLAAGAVQQGRLLGDPAAAMAGTPSATVDALRLPAGSLCIGLGALGGKADDELAHAGELLAVGGLAIVLPGDDPAHPDWLVQQGEWVPEAAMLYGIHASGEFAHLLRFGTTPDAPAIRLSELAQAALQACQSDTVVFAAAAETAALVGAARQSPPSGSAGDFFQFPSIRDRLLFTAEPAYGDESCLLVGIAARNPAPPALAAFLRPLDSSGTVQGHVHGAVVPYRPIHKGAVELASTLESLMENQRIRGVLHLLNDRREGVGAGESALRRGALWCAPLRVEESAD